jgi:hypothetical protein
MLGKITLLPGTINKSSYPHIIIVLKFEHMYVIQ